MSRERCAVYLEVGAKRVFAGAVDWPGWCRSGPDEPSALQALLDYGPRYAAVVRSARLGFASPTRLADLPVVERVAGNATTDFGAPGVIPSVDRASASAADHARFEKLFRAGWRALDAARKRATGKALSKGPRGGGRELDAIIRHVVDSDRGYLGGFGWKAPSAGAEAEVRAAIIAALGASARGEIAARGPRGGVRWPVRYFVRRSLWHTIAHAWEIERRVL